MAEIRVKDNESLDSALRRFKRQCARAGVLNEVRKREHYEKPSVNAKEIRRAVNANSDKFLIAMRTGLVRNVPVKPMDQKRAIWPLFYPSKTGEEKG